MKFPDSELWDFSIRTYGIPDVEKACLNLQNDHGADVNLLLYCCWCAGKKIQLSAEDIDTLVQTTAPWQDSILKPLRSTRSTMKQQTIALPADMLEQTIADMREIEINAEHMAQLALEKAIDLDARSPRNDTSAIEISTANLATYLERLEPTSANDANTELARLLTAVYQDEEAVQNALMAGSG